MGFQIIRVTRREQRYRCPRLVRVNPVSLCPAPVALSTSQAPAVFSHSRKRLLSPEQDTGQGVHFVDRYPGAVVVELLYPARGTASVVELPLIEDVALVFLC